MPSLAVPDVVGQLRAAYWVGRDEMPGAPFPMSFKVGWWRRGFLAESAVIYDLAHKDPSLYVSDFARLSRCAKVNRMPQLFDHKLWLRGLLSARGFAQADTVALLAAGTIQMRPLAPAPFTTSVREFENFLHKDRGRFIVKPQDGTRGQGIFRLESRDGALVATRRGKTSPFSLDTSHGVRIVERAIEQGAFWDALHRDSANTLRVLTMWTPGDPEPFVACAVQRIGTRETAPTDNWSRGGICAPVDLLSGELGPGRMHPLKGRAADAPYTHHPQSGAPIQGACLPQWNEVKSTVLRAAAGLPANRYIGWDVLVDHAGRCVIIEANNNSDLNLLQAHGGLLANPAVRRFYQTVGVVQPL